MKTVIKIVLKTSILLIICLFSSSVQAHIATSANDFVAGFTHPWLGIDHLFVAMAIGAWSALQMDRKFRWLPVIFLLSLSCGLLLSTIAVNWLGMEIAIILSIMVCILLVSLQLQLSLAAAILLTGTFGLFQGNIHAVALQMTNVASFIGLFLASSLMLLVSWQLTRIAQTIRIKQQWCNGLAFLGVTSLLLSVAG